MNMGKKFYVQQSVLPLLQRRRQKGEGFAPLTHYLKQYFRYNPKNGASSHFECTV